MKRIYFTTILAVFISGCSGPSRLDFKEEPLTREKYCVASNRLIPVKNSQSAEFFLQYTKEDSLKKAPLKATLDITQNGREYNINPHESLKLIIDGEFYDLPITNSFQKPLEVVNYNNVSLPSGRFLMLGSVNEITRRKMAFFLPLDLLSKILAAKYVTFKIAVPSEDVGGYPILLDLNADSLAFLKEFEQKCVNNFPN